MVGVKRVSDYWRCTGHYRSVAGETRLERSPWSHIAARRAWHLYFNRVQAGTICSINVHNVDLSKIEQPSVRWSRCGEWMSRWRVVHFRIWASLGAEFFAEEHHYLYAMSSKKTGRISFASITPNNLGTLRKLNSVLFPIRYTEKFYQDVLLPELEDFCKLGPSSWSFPPVAVQTVVKEIDIESLSLFQRCSRWDHLLPIRNERWADQTVSHDYGRSCCEYTPVTTCVHSWIKCTEALPGSTVRFPKLGAYFRCCVLSQKVEN